MVNRGINKVILIGYVGQEPETRYMSNGNAVTHISVATTEAWKDKHTNEFKEKTEWHRIVLFGKIADIASNYLHKGSQVYLEGSLRTRKWQNQDGKNRYITEIIISIGGVMQILNNRYKESTSDIANSDSPENTTENFQNNEKLQDKSMINFEEDDIPF